MCDHDWTYDYPNLTRRCIYCGANDAMRVTLKPASVSVEVLEDEAEEILDGE